MKSRNWLGCHRRMFAYYGGVAHVTVPDCLKQGVLKCHLYDPDLNPAYAQLATDYSTAVVPARAKKPRDKAVVEGLVKILMRYVRFRYRRQRFTSLSEINRALSVCIERINDRRHTPLWRLAPRTLREGRESRPQGATDRGRGRRGMEGREAARRLLPLHRGRLLQRPAYPPAQEATRQDHREPGRDLPQARASGDPPPQPPCNGRRIKIVAHFPPASLAFYEATPQKLLSQSRFIHPELNRLFVELFNADVYGNIRRCQGFVSRCTKEINQSGHELASERIASAIESMRRYNRFRVPVLQGAARSGPQTSAAAPGGARDRAPARKSHAALRRQRRDTDDAVPIPSTTTQENLDL